MRRAWLLYWEIMYCSEKTIFIRIRHRSTKYNTEFFSIIGFIFIDFFSWTVQSARSSLTYIIRCENNSDLTQKNFISKFRETGNRFGFLTPIAFDQILWHSVLCSKTAAFDPKNPPSNSREPMTDSSSPPSIPFGQTLGHSLLWSKKPTLKF
jgi:hypothetical protein